MTSTSRSNTNKERAAIFQSVTKAMTVAERKATGDAVEKILHHAPLEDMRLLPHPELARLVVSGHKALTSKSQLVISIEALGDTRSLIVIAMGNRPFIVDSALADITDHNHDIQLVLHPLMDSGGKRGLTSLVIVVVEKMSADAIKAMKVSLKTVMEQIKQVTADWQPMLARIGEKVAEFRVTPPPVPAGEIAECVQFLEWLSDNNFTFLGLREYSYEGDRKSGELKPIPGSAMGILSDPDMPVMTRAGKPVVLTPEIRDFLFRADPLIITKANVRSKVHRRSYLDYIGIKRYKQDGTLAGELRVVGLFTSTTYTKSVMTIPVLRHKANAVLKELKADPASHTGKALLNIIEVWPRDEMFQLDQKTLTQFAEVAAQLDERPRIRVLSRPDRFDRFVSVIVFVPRDRYDSDARREIAAYLAKVYEGRLSAFYPAFLENGLTRVHFIIGRQAGKTPHVSREELESAVSTIVQTWRDRLLQEKGVHESAAPELDFSLAYQQKFSTSTAVIDAGLVNTLETSEQIALDIHDPDEEDGNNRIGLKLFHLDQAVPLSQRVPLLENMGFRVIEESTYEIERPDQARVFAHDMLLETETGHDVDRKASDEPVKDCLQAAWNRKIGDDKFNSLVLVAGLSWHQASVFRAIARYLRQVRSRFTVYSMSVTLTHYPAIVGNLWKLFEARFDPSVKNRDAKQKQLIGLIETALNGIESSDDDRIIQHYLEVIRAMLRTNFYQQLLPRTSTSGAHAPAPVLTFKIDPSAVGIMPRPVPYRELFVSSPVVEGLHLRFGPVARGGLRWSDRAQDYRTEVLGLVKAQQVKNAVIVPVGSKGGFVPKDLPTGDRNAFFEAGRAAYQVFISSLLSVTDNLVDGKVVSPTHTVCHDGDDPYFVVAADKGTSTFSDTANEISQAYDFWLDDAFASGGSAGYDHKKMGITACGAWEAVKRHFREMDRDIQTQPFTACGVGDMSGDVFGNGMLLSKQTRLIAAFDHRDIFIDPDPNIPASYKERARIFKLGRSSWQDYNTKLISKGGGVFSRSAKTIALNSAAAKVLDIPAGNYTPQQIMNAILKMPIDLMWFGGIGTYIRATHESDAEAGDRANDPIRVTAKELRCKVIGEGANLGVTHPGRIEFNQLGGCCNSDAIDNSAGVNSSDVEVNIKIALAAAMQAKKLTRPKRNTLLESMTETVAELVLRNNYLQTLAISLSQRLGLEDFSHQQRLMQALEARDKLDRVVEDLPDDIVMAERKAVGDYLTRAEIGVLLAYAKIVALDDLIDSDLPDDPYLERELLRYFPDKMKASYLPQIANHRLRREIIATGLANSMINRGGTTFLNRVTDRSGAGIDVTARAYVAVRDAFSLQHINAQIDALDNKIKGDVQLELYAIVQDRVLSQTIWFVRYGDYSKGIGAVVADYGAAVNKLMPMLETIVPDNLASRIQSDAARFMDAGVPTDLASTLARLPIAGLIPDILYAAKQTGKPLDRAANVFFRITDEFRVGRMVQAASEIEVTDYYDGLALDRALQSLHLARRDIVIDILGAKSKSGNPAEIWLAKNPVTVEQTKRQLTGIVDKDHATVSRLTVAANVLADLARG